MKAIASGNPAVLTLAEADAELQRLATLKRNHADEQYTARRSLRELPDTIDRLKKRLDQLQSDAATVAKSHVVPKPEVIAKAVNSIPDDVTSTRQFPLGTYRGIKCGVEVHPGGAADVYLEGRAYRKSMLNRQSRGPKAVFNGLERICETYDEVIATLSKEKALAKNQLADFQLRIGRVFTHTAYIDELSVLRDRLKAALATEPKEGEPTTAELADRVAQLRGRHQIEVGSVKARSENPVVPLRRKTAAAPITALPEPTLVGEPPPEDDDTPPRFTARIVRGGQMTLF